MDWLEKIDDWIRGITKISMLLLALGIVLQVLLGGMVPFIGNGIIANMMAMISSMGSQGLVGLLALGVVFWLFRHYKV
tara:strand:- start:1379 stop:1612 length:234 start_codon:yes stop_codon:yes gene_type:complete